MKYQTIAEVYEGNDKIREKLKATVANLSEQQANTLPEGEKWTVAGIVEHLSMVEDGITRVSAKLLKAAQPTGGQTNGEVKFSEIFLGHIAGAGEKKFEAPERIHPSGILTIKESLARMEENRQKLYELRSLFETIDPAGFTFPHPAFGELTAHEWLALVGGHELRHIRQIEKLLEKIG